MKLIPQYAESKQWLKIAQDNIREPETTVNITQYAVIIENMTDKRQSDANIIVLTIQTFLELKQPFFDEFQDLLTKHTKF